jgi:2-dehydropantoate 2-reductase
MDFQSTLQSGEKGYFDHPVVYIPSSFTLIINFEADLHRHLHLVLRTTEEAAQEEFDYVIVTMKALPDVYDVSEIIRPGLSQLFASKTLSMPIALLIVPIFILLIAAVTVGKTTIVLIQNGIGLEEPIVSAFPSNPVISIVAYIATSQISAGVIKMMGDENLVMAEFPQPNVDGEQQAKQLLDLFDKGGVSIRMVPDIEGPRWHKLIL